MWRAHLAVLILGKQYGRQAVSRSMQGQYDSISGQTHDACVKPSTEGQRSPPGTVSREDPCSMCRVDRALRGSRRLWHDPVLLCIGSLYNLLRMHSLLLHRCLEVSVEHTWQCRCQERSLLRELGIWGFQGEHGVAVLLCPSWRWTIVQSAVDVCRLLQDPIACVGIQDLHTKRVTISTSIGLASAA